MTTAAAPIERMHHAPCSNRDYDFFYAGLEQGHLLVQRCTPCGTLRNPPAPACPRCRSFDWTARPMSGRGTVFSHVVHRHPPLPGFASPHPVALIELEEGVRFVGAMDGTPLDAVAVGLPVAAEFLRRGDVAAIRFRPA
jgi:uncharacterized protein